MQVFRMAADPSDTGRLFKMVQIQNILCPVDFFPASQRALEYATALARNYEARLHILHVVSPVLPTSYEFSINTADLTRSFEQQTLATVEKMGQSARSSGIEVNTAVRTGDIADELKVSIGETATDFMVMGTHGRRGFERWFMGSVTERLLRHATVPVLILSDAHADLRVPPDLKKILVTTDFSEGTNEAMSYSLSLAQEARAEVTLLHVVQHTPEQAESVKPLTEVLAEHLDSMVPDEARDWCEVHSSVEIGTPYQRIIAATEDSDIDLLVMNIHGKGMVERALMGSTAERVIRAVTCPVLAVPAKIQWTHERPIPARSARFGLVSSATWQQ